MSAKKIAVGIVNSTLFKIKKFFGVNPINKFYYKQEIITIKSLNFSLSFPLALKRVNKLLWLIERDKLSFNKKELIDLKREILFNLNSYEGRIFSSNKSILIDPFVKSGSCTIEFNEAGGVAFHGKLRKIGETVFIFINGRMIKSVMPDKFKPVFKYFLNPATAQALPENPKITIVTNTGVLDIVYKNLNFSKFGKKKINGLSIFEHQKNGGLINKKGKLVYPGMLGLNIKNEEELSETLKNIYYKYKVFFKEKFGYDLFLIYGSLLGASRNGKAISHDDDFDISYLSKYSDPEDVKQEVIRITKELASNGFNLTLSFTGIIKPKERIAVDIYPAWINRGMLYCQVSTAVEMSIDDIFPLKEIDFCGVEFLAPSNSEKFLSAKYGNNWIVPDPSYKRSTPDYAKEMLRREKPTKEEHSDVINFIKNV